MRKGLFDWESEDCVEASIGKVKTRPRKLAQLSKVAFYGFAR